MVHLAGLDDKKKWIRQVLQDLRREQFDERTTQEKGTALTMSRKESLPFRQWWKYWNWKKLFKFSDEYVTEIEIDLSRYFIRMPFLIYSGYWPHAAFFFHSPRCFLSCTTLGKHHGGSLQSYEVHSCIFVHQCLEWVIRPISFTCLLQLYLLTSLAFFKTVSSTLACWIFLVYCDFIVWTWV